MRSIIIVLVSLIILIGIPFFMFKPTLESIKFSSIHPNIKITKSESTLFNIYSNYILKIKTSEMWGTNPKVIGIIYTDKIRPDNQVVGENGEINFGSLINITKQNEALIYIYISKNVIDGKDAKNEIKKYTVNAIRYFQQKDTRQIDMFSKYIKLPINVTKI